MINTDYMRQLVLLLENIEGLPSPEDVEQQSAIKNGQKIVRRLIAAMPQVPPIFRYVSRIEPGGMGFVFKNSVTLPETPTIYIQLNWDIGEESLFGLTCRTIMYVNSIYGFTATHELSGNEDWVSRVSKYFHESIGSPLFDTAQLKHDSTTSIYFYNKEFNKHVLKSVDWVLQDLAALEINRETKDWPKEVYDYFTKQIKARAL